MIELPVAVRPVIDRDILGGAHFGDAGYRKAALIVANRIRADLALQAADRLLAGYRNDSRWGNPVVLTATAGKPMLSARYEEYESRIAVDSIDAIREYPLTGGSVVAEFIRRFDAGAYPDLEA